MLLAYIIKVIRLKLERFVVGVFSINYEALFEQNTDAIMIVNKEGFVVEANQAFYALAQFEREDFRNRSYETFFQYDHDDDEVTAWD
ncbi:PAS domain-containing protein [Peribacillus asahii]|uniref:PAS domain-containing protein n=1 Tax=Peribacillus asahii TaxID=228899 RepID=A0A398AV71_9BACI|nr:PAS domain-containing protein [Peribacillus asahii]